MLNFERITKLNIEEKLKIFSERNTIPLNFFGHFAIIQSILNQTANQLFWVTDLNSDEIAFIVADYSDYRFMFKEPSDIFLEKFIEEKKPHYISANILPNPSSKNICNAEQEELIVDIDKILSLSDKSFRKDYNQSVKNNPTFKITDFDYKRDVADLLIFLDEWRYSRTDEQNQFARIESDLNFLVNYGHNKDIFGVIIRDVEKIIAYCIFAPYTKNTCTSFFSKILRGYKNLGTFLTVEKCKSMKESGFSEYYIGSINNDFKKSLIWASKTIKMYHAELYSMEDIKFKNRERFLTSFF